MHVSDNEIDNAKEYIAWVSERVRFLDSICPEMVLLEGLIGEDETKRRAKTNKEAKSELIREMQARGHRTDATSLSAAASFIVTADKPVYRHINALADTMKEFLAKSASV